MKEEKLLETVNKSLLVEDLAETISRLLSMKGKYVTLYLSVHEGDEKDIVLAAQMNGILTRKGIGEFNMVITTANASYMTYFFSGKDVEMINGNTIYITRRFK